MSSWDHIFFQEFCQTLHSHHIPWGDISLRCAVKTTQSLCVWCGHVVLWDHITLSNFLNDSLALPMLIQHYLNPHLASTWEFTNPFNKSFMQCREHCIPWDTSFWGLLLSNSVAMSMFYFNAFTLVQSWKTIAKVVVFGFGLSIA